MNKKTFTWLAIGAIIIAIAIKNRKDEEEAGNGSGTGARTGGGFVPETPKLEDSKPAQPKLPPSEFVDTTEKNRRVGDGLIV